MLYSFVTSFSCNTIPRSGSLALHGLNPNEKKILLHEVKLRETTQFTGGHIVGHARDKEAVLVTSPLVF